MRRSVGGESGEKIKGLEEDEEVDDGLAAAAAMGGRR